MHGIHIPLTGYGSLPEGGAPAVAAQLGELAQWMRDRHSVMFLAGKDQVVAEEAEQSVFMEFADPATPGILDGLRSEVASLAVTWGIESPGPASSLRFPLLQHASLTPPVFQSAVGFAQGVVDGLDLAGSANVHELALYRYASDAAGEDWGAGTWAADLRWQIASVHALYGAR